MKRRKKHKGRRKHRGMSGLFGKGIGTLAIVALAGYMIYRQSSKA